MKTKLRTFIVLTALTAVLSPGLVSAATTTTTLYSKSVGSGIPDRNASGLISGITVSGTDLITSIELALVTSGGWNGDLYAYLEHDDVISVLLNRPGVTSEDSSGAGSSGLNVTFSDAAALDAHTGLSSSFGELATGTFQPDGRGEDPALVTTSSPRTLKLSGFTGQVASGTWTLFIADLSSGDSATLDSWSLSLTTEPAATVPEASTSLIVLALGAGSLLARRRRAMAA
ncbi:proprotein convertase P-domain-containing protein [bacterium]|nr:proprotein convertase P-domain-containing protein [bacterium]